MSNRNGRLIAGLLCLVLILSTSQEALAQPALTASQATPGSIELRWPANSPDFVLETATSLGSGAVWSPANPGGALDGDFHVALVAVGEDGAFFRLRRDGALPTADFIHIRAEDWGLGRLGPLVVRPDGRKAYAGRVYSNERARGNVASISLDPVADVVLGVDFHRDSSNPLPLEGRSSVGRMLLHPNLRKLYWFNLRDFPHDGTRAPVAELVVMDLDEAGNPVGEPRSLPSPNPLSYLDAMALHPSLPILYVGGYGSSALYRYQLDPSGEPTSPPVTHELGEYNCYEIAATPDGQHLLLGLQDKVVASLGLDAAGAPVEGSLAKSTFGENPAAPFMRFITVGRGLYRVGVSDTQLRSPIALQGWSLDAAGLPPATEPMLFPGIGTLAGPVAASGNQLLVAEAQTLSDTFSGELLERGFVVRFVPLGEDGLPVAAPSDKAKFFRRDLMAMAAAGNGQPVVATQPPSPGAHGYFPGNEARGYALRLTPLAVDFSNPGAVDGFLALSGSPAGEVVLPGVQAVGQSGVVDIDAEHRVGRVPVSALAWNAGPVLFTARAVPIVVAPDVEVAVTRSRWRVEVFDGPVEGRLPVKVLEAEVEGDQLAFLLPGYGFLDEGMRVAGIRTLNEHVAAFAAAARAVAVPEGDRPRLFMASAFHNVGSQPSLEQLMNSSATLGGLGFNTLLPDGWGGVDPAVVNQAFNSHGLTGRGLAFYLPLLGHSTQPEPADLAYFDFFLRDQAVALTNWLNQDIRAYEKGGGFSRDAVVDMKIADEPAWYYPEKMANVRTNALFQARFTQYLAAKGLTPADVGAADWAEVAPQAGGFLLDPNPPLPLRRLFYWTTRFYAESAVEGMARTRAAVDEVLGRAINVDVNWNNFLNEWYTPSPNAKLYNNSDTGPDAAVGSMDWFHAGRLSAHTLWSEDWVPDQDAQEWSFRADLLRSAAMEGASSFGSYVIGQTTGMRPWGAAQKIFALVGHGGKGIDMYTWGPDVISPDAWGAITNTYAPVARAMGLLGRSERVLFPGRPSRGSVAVLLPAASRIWGANSDTPLYLDEARFQHYALTHAGYSVDLLDEQAIASNDFAARGYQAIYVNGPNLPPAAVANLAAWVGSGGVLAITPGAAVADEYDEPNGEMDLLAGLGARVAVRVVSPQPLLPVGDCLLSDSLLGTNTIPVITPGIRLALAGAAAVASWSDGGVAIASRTVGAGRVLSYGFFPGQQYWITSDRDNSVGSPFYSKRLPFGWGKAQRDMAVLPARVANASRKHTSSHELVEVCVLRSDAGIGLVLLNWSDTPIANYSVSVPDVGEFTRVTAATGAPVVVSEQDGVPAYQLPLGDVEVLLLERP